MDKKNGNHAPVKVEVQIEAESQDEGNVNNNNNYMDEKKKYLFLNYRDPNPASPWNPQETPQKHVFGLNGGHIKMSLFSPITAERDASFCLDETKSMTNDASFGLSSSLQLETGDCLTPGYKERHIKITDPDKGLECIGRELAQKEFSVDWREYWDFIDAFIDIREEEGLQLLEAYFAKRVESETKMETQLALHEALTALKQLPIDGKSDAIVKLDETYPQAKSKPYVVVEKSLQVYAKRITKVFLCNHNDTKALSKLLVYELKRLKTLISSFKEDQRFQLVDVSKVHARMARLVNYFVAVSLELTNEIKDTIKNVLKDFYMEAERCDYFKCFCSMFLLIFNNPKSANYCLDPKEEVCQVDWESEQSCNCDWDINLSRKTSRRHRYKSGTYSKDTSVVAKDDEDAQKTDVDQLVADMNDSLKIEHDVEAMDVEDEEFFDCVESDESFADNSDTDDDIFFTPLQNRSKNDLMELQDETTEKSKKLFIYSDIPTKRDLDVLNALADVTLDAKIYPNIVAWKAAVLSYSKEEMAEFPTPTVVKKTHAPSRTLHDILCTPSTPKKVNITAVATVNDKTEPQQALPIRKRLLLSPTLKIFRKPTSETTVLPTATTTN